MKNINLKVIDKLSTLNEKIEKFSEINIFRGSGITLGQYQLLKLIIDNKVSTINELKSSLVVSAPALSQILGRMETTGLITREINKLNKRETKIFVTPKAKNIFEKVTKKNRKIFNEKFSELGSDKITKLYEYLNEIETHYNHD